MHLTSRLGLALAALTLFAGPGHSQSSPEVGLVRQFVDHYNGERVGTLVAAFTPEMRQALPEDQARAFFAAAEGRIAGFQFVEWVDEGAPRYAQTRLGLPFEGTWYVFWGGKSHRGTGERNEDYLAYGRPVLAPCDGTVVMVVDGVRMDRAIPIRGQDVR